jgi:hypothetical protein
MNGLQAKILRDLQNDPGLRDAVKTLISLHSVNTWEYEPFNATHFYMKTLLDVGILSFFDDTRVGFTSGLVYVGA